MSDDATDVEQLIALVSSRPILWDKTLDKYRHLPSTKAAWVEVFRKLNEDYDNMTHWEQEKFSRETNKKWANLRDAYVKSLKRNRKYVYGDQLQFLARLYEGRDPEQDDDEREVEDEGKSSQLRDLLADVCPEDLIGSVEKYPCLWDKSLATYKERHHMKSAWMAVVREIKPDFDQLEDYDQEQFRREIVKKWNNMRDTFAKSLKRNTGSGSFKAKKYVYADQMHFLRRFYAGYGEAEGDDEWHNQMMDDDMATLPEPPDVVIHEDIEETLSLSTWDVQPEEPEPPKLPGKPPAHHTPLAAPFSFTNPKKRKRQEQHDDEVDQKILSVLDRLEPDNRHISFFRGIIPSLENFNEDEILEVQMKVIQIISDIRTRRKPNQYMKNTKSGFPGNIGGRRPMEKIEDISDQSSGSME